MHALTRNLEWIVASHTKESSIWGAHKKVWTKEEEVLLVQLVERFAGSRNINQLIAEQIPSKMAKQISDKRRLLARGPSALVKSGPEGRVGENYRSKSAGLPKGVS